MKIRNIVVPVLTLTMLAACSFDKQRVDYKTGSSQVPALEIPPDLTSIAANDQYTIPGGDGSSAANFSDYSKSVKGVTSKSANSNAVLPVLTNRHIERNGMQHWIVIESKAENVWPSVKAFWTQLGFRIVVDNPNAGVLETDWLENHGNVPRSYVRNTAGNGKAIDSLKSEGIRDQYITRIERSKDGLHTEVHISRQVMQESQIGNRKDFKWLPHENDPELEIAVLQMLMDKLGSDPTQVLPKSKTNTANSVLPAATPAPATETLDVINVQLKDTATGKAIQLNEPFDRSWRRVGLALDSGHIVTTDKDRSKGIYFVSTVPEKDKKKPHNDYQVTVRENASGSEVTVVDQNGKIDAESARLTDVLYRALGNNPNQDGRPATGDKSGIRSGDAVRPSR
jgi:outer membrane protein assembly factor BamC